MIIQINVIILICIITLYLAIRNFFKIPDINTIHKLIENTNIESILIYSRFSKIKTISIINQRFKLSKPEFTEKRKILGPVETIKSEWIGAFYLVNDVDNKPYITLGQMIKPGECIGHIISMNLKTEVLSKISGKVIGIAIGNNRPIDFGRVIMYVEKI